MNPTAQVNYYDTPLLKVIALKGKTPRREVWCLRARESESNDRVAIIAGAKHECSRGIDKSTCCDQIKWLQNCTNIVIIKDWHPASNKEFTLV